MASAIRYSLFVTYGGRCHWCTRPVACLKRQRRQPYGCPPGFVVLHITPEGGYVAHPKTLEVRFYYHATGDHVVPRWRGGSNEDNVVLSCERCNAVRNSADQVPVHLQGMRGRRRGLAAKRYLW